MFASEAFPAGCLLGTLVFVPETPRWLTQQRREAEAIDFLTRISGSAEGTRQFQNIKKVIALEGRGSIQL